MLYHILAPEFAPPACELLIVKMLVIDACNDYFIYFLNFILYLNLFFFTDLAVLFENFVSPCSVY